MRRAKDFFKKILFRNLKSTAALFLIIFFSALLVRSAGSPIKTEIDFAGEEIFPPIERAPSSEESPLRFTQVSEVEFFKKVEVEAAKSFEAVRPMLDHPITQSQWLRIIRVVCENLSQIAAFKKTAVELSHKAGVTLVVSEVVTSFILPSILAAMGQPALAALFVAVPMSPFIAAGKVIAVNSFDRYKLSRDLGISVSELDAFRTKLLGIEKTDHILSLSYEIVDEELPRILDMRIVNSIKGSKARDAFRLKDLVRIVSEGGSDGELFLTQIASHRGKTALYTAELITFIRKKPVLLTKLISQMKLREELPDNLAKLKRINLRMAELSAEMNTLGDELKVAYKKIKRNLALRETHKLNRYLKDSSHLTMDAFEAVQLAEYQLLATYKQSAENKAALEAAENILSETVLYFESRVKINRAVLSYLEEEIPYNVYELPKLFDAEERFRPKAKISECMVWTLPFLGI